jgi:hypothetical protein
MKKLAYFCVLAMLGFCPWVPPASATLMLMLGTPNAALSCCTGPYATVSVTRTSNTTADIEFDSLTNGGYVYLMGDGGTADLNVNGTYVLGPVTETNSIAGFTPDNSSTNSPGNVNGFGFFNLSLNNFDGFTDTATKINFTLTNTSGISWLTDADVLAPNDHGAFAAVHSFACAQPDCSTTSGAFVTGFAGGSTPGLPPPVELPVPEPQTLALLAFGLVSLVLVRLQR